VTTADIKKKGKDTKIKNWIFMSDEVPPTFPSGVAAGVRFPVLKILLLSRTLHTLQLYYMLYKLQTSYIAPLGVTVFDFRLFWGSEPLVQVRPTFIKFDQYRPTLILSMDWVTISD
jgi:hypothetical protein